MRHGEGILSFSEGKKYKGSFFQNSINRKLVTKESIYEKLNLKIRSYDEDIEFFAKKLESKNRVDHEKIFESKENFINYIKDIFASTIKVKN